MTTSTTRKSAGKVEGNHLTGPPNLKRLGMSRPLRSPGIVDSDQWTQKGNQGGNKQKTNDKTTQTVDISAKADGKTQTLWGGKRGAAAA